VEHLQGNSYCDKGIYIRLCSNYAGSGKHTLGGHIYNMEQIHLHEEWSLLSMLNVILNLKRHLRLKANTKARYSSSYDRQFRDFIIVDIE
jgi:hypothetical protein